jgi:hypothetical protein
MNGSRNFAFERFIRSAASKNSAGSIAGIVLLALFGLFFLGFGIAIPFVPIILIGLLPIGGIAMIVARFKGDLKGGEYWINLLVLEPEKIVWIKPVNIRHTAAYVVTLYEEMHFQIMTSEGLGILIKCNTREDQVLFIGGMRQYVPHAHLGYSDIINFHYKSDPTAFIQELKESGLYQPVLSMEERSFKQVNENV